MATNKKKIFVTQTMSPRARALLNEREDIELVEFPNLISAKDFEAMLKQHAPVHGVALGATRFGETELEASKDMKVVTRIGVGYDAVDVPALSKRKVPLIHLHGDQDTEVPYSFAMPSAMSWAMLDGCTAFVPGGPTYDLDANVPGAETESAIAGCASPMDVELWTMQGVGHIPSYNASFMPTIWGWFESH